MAWHIYLWNWLAHAALGALLILAAGCLAVRLCRQPVRRLRLAELTMLGCLLAPWLHLVPGLPGYPLGWLRAPQPEATDSAPAADEPAPFSQAREAMTPEPSTAPTPRRT